VLQFVKRDLKSSHFPPHKWWHYGMLDMLIGWMVVIISHCRLVSKNHFVDLEDIQFLLVNYISIKVGKLVWKRTKKPECPNLFLFCLENLMWNCWGQSVLRPYDFLVSESHCGWIARSKPLWMLMGQLARVALVTPHSFISFILCALGGILFSILQIKKKLKLSMVWQILPR
jgi:hypothetical protein